MAKSADFCLSDIHFAANILDPRFRGELLTEEEDIKGMQFIAETATKIASPDVAVDFQTQVLVQLGEFKTMSGAFSHEFKWQAAKAIHIQIPGGVHFRVRIHCRRLQGKYLMQRQQQLQQSGTEGAMP